MARVTERWRDAWQSMSGYFGSQKWTLVFCAFVWALVWYSSMNLLGIYKPTELLPEDILPIAAGIPIVLLGWRAVRLGQQLSDSINNFDDGAAFAFPAGRPGAKGVFLADLKATVRRWSTITAFVMVAIPVIGAILISPLVFDSADPFVRHLLGMLLLVGMPLIALPIGVLLGQLVGYAQLLRVIDRNDITIAGLGTPPAREALRGLEGVYSFAVLATTLLCAWFGAWEVSWALGLDPYSYAEEWKVFYLAWWGLSLMLFIGAAAWPSWSFNRRVAALSGGFEGRKATEEQIKQAEADLANAALLPGTSRQRRERAEELHRFIVNLKDQRIESWVLSMGLHVAFLAFNLVLFVWVLAQSSASTR